MFLWRAPADFRCVYIFTTSFTTSFTTLLRLRSRVPLARSRRLQVYIYIALLLALLLALLRFFVCAHMSLWRAPADFRCIYSFTTSACGLKRLRPHALVVKLLVYAFLSYRPEVRSRGPQDAARVLRP
jgi:hypothetical protein